jgi:hypothetical protein
MRRTLYLDTMLWNRLFEQAIDPRLLTQALKDRGWELAISPHVMYELAKSFRAKRIASQRKAVPLFSYLERFLEFPIACVKQVPDLLREEIKVAHGGVSRIDPLYREAERDRMTSEIRHLAAGHVDPRFDVLFGYRSGQVAISRASTPERAAKWELWKKNNSDLNLEGFFEMSQRVFAADMMRTHISDVVVLSPKDVRRLARKMLSAPRFRFSRALVNANIYLDWLTFQGRAIPRDVLDDCYHIENAAHCDAYATDEPGQEVAANAILRVTEVRIHDKKEPLLEWLATAAIQ